MESENWLEIEGFDGKYQVSNQGRVKCMWRQNQYKDKIGKPFILKQQKHRQGYMCVDLTKDGVTKKYYVHRLVAQAFIPNPDNLPEVNHKSENKSENFVENLEWCDGKYNSNFGTRVERHRELVSKPIIQTTIEGDFVRKFKSATAAEEECGYNATYISQVCHGKRKNAYGYCFHFANPCILMEALEDLWDENKPNSDFEE